MRRGIFITFEGPEGSGKSTQIQLLKERIEREKKREVVLTREPGGTPLAEEFRKILKYHTGSEPIYPAAEVLLFEAGRVQNVNHFVKPALADGKIVLCDRFCDSTLAYQGFARKLNIEQLRNLNLFAMDGVEIDMTVLLDISTEAGFARTGERASTKGVFDRMEAEDAEFYQNVRCGFLELAAAEPGRFRVFNAEKEKNMLADEIYQEVARVL